MTSQLDKKLCSAAARTFEDLCFMITLGDDAQDRDDPQAKAQASVQFTGAFSGKLVLRASDSLLTALAANMLGDPDDVTDQQQMDALGEAANVVCGNLLPDIAGSEEVFRISAPQVHGDPQGPCDGPEPAATASLELDEGWVDLAFYIDGQPGLQEVDAG